jgi:chondroitin AC lyase
MDFNACGRQLFKNAQRGKSIALARAMSDMESVDSAHSDVYREASQSILLHGESAPGNVCFYRSDIMSHKGKGWYVSVKMSSPRVIGTETGNGENLLGYYLADGVTAIMKAGDEYENIFPFWDWRKLPGATIPQSNEPLPVLSWKGYRNGSGFAGGVSDGKTGLAAFCLQRDSVFARKAWFLFPGRMVCLGSDLASAAGKPLLTTINQTRKKGDVHLLNSNRKWQVTDRADWTLKAPVTCFHAGFGYQIDDADEVTLSAGNRPGNWRTVVDCYEDTPLEAPVFTAFLKDRQGKYAYSVFPAETYEDALQSVQGKSWRILCNDSVCQAVSDKEENIVQAVFYRQGAISLADISTLKNVRFEARRPALFIVRETSVGWQIHVADPTRHLPKISFSLSGKYKTGAYDGKSKTTLFEVDLPSGEKAGSTLVLNLFR